MPHTEFNPNIINIQIAIALGSLRTQRREFVIVGQSTAETDVKMLGGLFVRCRSYRLSYLVKLTQAEG